MVKAAGRVDVTRMLAVVVRRSESGVPAVRNHSEARHPLSCDTVSAYHSILITSYRGVSGDSYPYQ